MMIEINSSKDWTHLGDVVDGVDLVSGSCLEQRVIVEAECGDL